MKTRTASAIAFLVLASLTSCSEADKRDVLDGPLPAPSRLALSIKLPFDKCEITLPEYYQISDAQDILTKSCMEKRGFDWPQVSRPKNAIDLRNRRRYGVIEEFVAREYGYHSGAKLANPCIVAQREEGRNQRLSKDARVAALNRESGCAFKSIEEMRSAPVGTVKMDRFYSLGNGAMERSQKSPRVISAMKKMEPLYAQHQSPLCDPL